MWRNKLSFQNTHITAQHFSLSDSDHFFDFSVFSLSRQNFIRWKTLFDEKLFYSAVWTNIWGFSTRMYFIFEPLASFAHRQFSFFITSKTISITFLIKDFFFVFFCNKLFTPASTLEWDLLPRKLKMRITERSK